MAWFDNAQGNTGTPQDRWGRLQGDPQFGQPPPGATALGPLPGEPGFDRGAQQAEWDTWHAANPSTPEQIENERRRLEGDAEWNRTRTIPGVPPPAPGAPLTGQVGGFTPLSAVGGQGGDVPNMFIQGTPEYLQRRDVNPWQGNAPGWTPGAVGSNAPSDPRNPLFTSANAPRVQQNAQGQWVLTEHGNTRMLQPNEVQQATAYANQFWTDNPTGFQMNNPLTLPDAYQQFLGRAPDAAGLAAHQRNPGGTAAALNAIMSSPEAAQYRASAPGQAGGTVMLRAPTGQTKAVPADQVAYYLARGAQRI